MLLGLPIHHTERVDRRDRLHLKFITNNKHHFGKQIKCSAKNHLGNAVDYAEIPGNNISKYRVFYQLYYFFGIFIIPHYKLQNNLIPSLESFPPGMTTSINEETDPDFYGAQKENDFYDSNGKTICYYFLSHTVSHLQLNNFCIS